MSFFPLSQDNFELFTLVTTPSRQFSSSSLGVTGSVHVFPRRSDVEKDVNDPKVFTDIAFSQNSLASTLDDIKSKIDANPTTNIKNMMEGYLQQVSAQSVSARKQKSLAIHRYTPSSSFGIDTLRKAAVQNYLFPYYRNHYTNCNYSFTNYHCLNFFTASSVPSNTTLLYPNEASDSDNDGYVSGSYVCTGPFSFEFHINVRNSTLNATDPFVAGTVMHLSSCYAVSIISGSSKDETGRPNSFRVLLQLSHSADISPSMALPGTYPNDLVFLSNDNVLQKNNWHHVAVSWGTVDVDDGFGVFVVDGQSAGEFLVPSASIAPLALKYNPDVLCIGNYYNGPNDGEDTCQSLFFSADPALRDGVNQLHPRAGVEQPLAPFYFNNPLNAELHDIIIRNDWLDTSYFNDLDFTVGPAQLDNVIFYLPPYFTEESPTRTKVGNHGGVFTTPFSVEDGTTDTPFNAKMAFSVMAHDINLENFTMDWAQQVFPRLWNLTGSIIDPLTTGVPTATRGYMDLTYDDYNSGLPFGVPVSVSAGTIVITSVPDGLQFTNLTGGTVHGFHDIGGGIFENTYTPFLFEALVNGTTSNLPDGTGINVTTSPDPKILCAATTSINWITRFGTNFSAPTPGETANEFSFVQPSIRKRNLTILPCDDGNFFPNYDVLYSTGKVSTGSFVDDLGHTDLSSITLRDMIDLNVSFIDSIDQDQGSLMDVIAGPSPEAPVSPETGLGLPTDVLTVFQRTRDASSNEIVIFDISNLFYGNNIEPGTFSITDGNISGSNGRVSITLKDNGLGSLFRADSLSQQADWNCVGNIFYNEGIVILKTPVIPFFGKDQYEISFKGRQNIHSLKINTFLPAGQLNVSTNPNYQELSASSLAWETGDKYVNVSHINFHDQNYNIVAKTALAQTLVKRTGDKFLIRVGTDW